MTISKADILKWQRAPLRISLPEAISKYEMLYIENFEEYVATNEIQDWIQAKEVDGSTKPEELLIYTTYTTQITFDAINILEDACSEMHEEAMDMICSGAIQELQEFLDTWAEQHGKGTTTYWMDYKCAVFL